jgi:hypothetical protein
MTDPFASCSDLVGKTLFRPYSLVKFWIYGVFCACLLAIAFWREPLVMLSLAGAGSSISFFLSWLVAPKKSPSPEPDEQRQK